MDETLTLDPDDFERKITPYTKAVIPVHMRGVPCDMDRIMAIARKHNLKVIEDVRPGLRRHLQGQVPGHLRRLWLLQLPVPQDHHRRRRRHDHHR